MSNFENGKTLRNRLNGRTQKAQKRQRKKKSPTARVGREKDGQFCFKKAEL